MYFYQFIKRLTIDIIMFFAVVISLFFLFDQMIPFIKSAVSLHVMNWQTIPYMIYALLLILLPVTLLSHSMRISKTRLLRAIFFCFAATILIGSVGDLITYRFFIGYNFSEGDAVFVNILWNMPNLLGVLFSLIIAVLYIALGIQIRYKRRVSYILYLVIFLLSALAPFLYTYIATGYLPRETWIKKAAFIIPEQLLILISLSICVTSRELWVKHIWNH